MTHSCLPLAASFQANLKNPVVVDICTAVKELQTPAFRALADLSYKPNLL